MKLLRKILLLALVLAMVALGVLFALQNKALVPLDLLVYRFEPHSLALWLLLALALGGALGLLMSSAIMLRQRAAHGSLRRQLTRANSELEKLRSSAPQVGE